MIFSAGISRECSGAFPDSFWQYAQSQVVTYPKGDKHNDVLTYQLRLNALLSNVLISCLMQLHALQSVYCTSGGTIKYGKNGNDNGNDMW